MMINYSPICTPNTYLLFVSSLIPLLCISQAEVGGGWGGEGKEKSFLSKKIKLKYMAAGGT